VGPLPLRAVYTVGELAEAAGMSRRRLARLLDRLGVRTLRSDTTPLVPLSELEAKVEPFWESIQTIEMLRRRDR
jgi:hypothetical protein